MTIIRSGAAGIGPDPLVLPLRSFAACVAMLLFVTESTFVHSLVTRAIRSAIRFATASVPRSLDAPRIASCARL